MEGSIDASAFGSDPDNEPSSISPKMVYRILRMMAIDRHHIMTLFHEMCGVKLFTFDTVLKEIAEDFDVPLKKLQDVDFAPYGK